MKKSPDHGGRRGFSMVPDQNIRVITTLGELRYDLVTKPDLCFRTLE